jgi:cobalt-zinc-cadmium efflux system protein
MAGKTRILIAFILNLCFAVFEFIGGLFTGSVSILSDSIHDIGDAASIGISYFMEKISERPPDKQYTYGYRRYSILGGLITTIILLIGSIVMISGSIYRLINPIEINYDGMIVLAIIGCVINFIAGKITHHKHSINQKAVSLHMLEDMLGWIIVLIGAIVMRFTDWYFIDPILSIIMSIFIGYHAIKTLIQITNVFLVKIPKHINVDVIRTSLILIPGVSDIHHLHVWTIDGESVLASMHIVAKYSPGLKSIIKNTLKKRGIDHATIEFENIDEKCKEYDCNIKHVECHCGHHH